jgi:exodeoxyribonuclease-3
MKMATFNINNVNRRLPNLLRWLRSSKPDVVCLQELKSTDADFPIDAIRKAGYGAVWRGQKTWNGVAILARKADPIVIRTELPGDRDDIQARYIEAAVSGIIVTSIYLPNGNPQPGPKFDYKLDWFSGCAGTPRPFSSTTFPSCWPAISTWRRPASIFIRRVRGTRTR